ncbi:MAG: DNA-binding MarR family transcriptional regulator [Cellvibrionaceae bacterium]
MIQIQSLLQGKKIIKMKSDFKLHNSFAFWIYRLNNVLQDAFNQQLKDHDITWPQWMVLNVLDEGLANTPAVIADHLGADRSGITRLLDRLETKGFVIREHDKLDRRSIKLRMTSKGKGLMAQINNKAHQHQQQFLSELHLSERRGFKKELQKMLKVSGIDTAPIWQRID